MKMNVFGTLVLILVYSFCCLSIRLPFNLNLAGKKTKPPGVDCDVIIAGGGLSGLALCSFLRRNGVDCRVLEKGPALRFKSQGVIALWENGMSALNTMGLNPDKGAPMKAVYFSSRNSTGVIEKGNINVEGAFTPWSRVQDYLVTQIPDKKEEWLKCNAEVVGFHEEKTHVKAKLSDGSTLSSYVLVGADGTFSTLRKAISPLKSLLGLDSVRRYGLLNWASIVSLKNATANDLYKAYNPLGVGELRYVSSTTPALQSYLCNVDNDEFFWQVRVPRKAASRDLKRSDVRGGLGIPGTKAALLKYLKGKDEDLANRNSDIIAAVEACPESNIFQREILDRRPLRTWSSRGGRVVLMGDAAHSMNPSPGQGANQAFEDAAVLGFKLTEAHRSISSSVVESESSIGSRVRVTSSAPLSTSGLAEQGQVKAAIKRYEKERISRANWVHSYAAEMGRSFGKGMVSKISGNKVLTAYVRTFPPTGPLPDMKL